MNTEFTISEVIASKPVKIGLTFTANHFDESFFKGYIDPVVMVDHFHMYEKTFDPHPHAGISAVTYVFEDSVGAHFNFDSLGNQGPIYPGDMHWFAAGSGGVHTEQPIGEGRDIHALQIFVNLPSYKKMGAPYAVHVGTNSIPEYSSTGVRVRIVAGESNGITASYTEALPEPFTLLDCFLEKDGMFEHTIPPNCNAMVYTVSGNLLLEMHSTIQKGSLNRAIPHSHAIGISHLPSNQIASSVKFSCLERTHFVVLSGPALNETIVKKGPFVMNSEVELKERTVAYYRGEFGDLDLTSYKSLGNPFI